MNRVDQIGIIISNPFQTSRHYSIVEVNGLIVNFSNETLYITSHSYSSSCKSRMNPNIPKELLAHSSTEIINLLTIEFNKNDIDPVENVNLGHIQLQYRNSSGESFITSPTLFSIFLQY
jgi:hypothetical protein